MGSPWRYGAVDCVPDPIATVRQPAPFLGGVAISDNDKAIYNERLSKLHVGETRIVIVAGDVISGISQSLDNRGPPSGLEIDKEGMVHHFIIIYLPNGCYLFS